MRESAKIEKTHLPTDTYQEWLRSQKDEMPAKGHGTRVTANSFDAWMAKRVARKVKRAPGKTSPAEKPA